MEIRNIAGELPHHPSKRYRTRKAHDIKHIIVHHSATKPNSPDGRKDAEAFASYHISVRDWPGIGYDYVIGRDGTVWKTNENCIVNYHAGNVNKSSLGVCLVGDFDSGDVPEKQWESMIWLLGELMKAYGIPRENVLGHKEVPEAKTSCPGKHLNGVRVRRALK